MAAQETAAAAGRARPLDIAARLPLVAAAGAGAVMGLAQAPMDLAPALLPGGVLLAWLHARAAGWRPAARLGLAAGTGHFGLVLAWIVEPFLVDVARHGWMAPFALVGLAGGLALFWAAAFGLAARLAPPGAARILLLAAFWAGAEWLRGNILTGFPWALPAYGLLETPWLALAALVGPYGLTLLLLLAVSLPALGRRGALAGAAIAAVSLGLALRPAPAPPPPPGVTVRLVQPNAAQHLKWRPDQIPVFWERKMRATAAPGAPDVVIWPEVSAPFLHGTRPDAVAAMEDAARGRPVIYGTRRPSGDGRFFNMLAVTGTEVHYDKVHLVPFGEYMPFAETFARWGIFGLAAEEMGGYAPGPGLAPLAVRGLPPFLPLICYEAVFPEEVAAGRGAAAWMVHITNDAWFGAWTGPYQHLAQARFRAVEQGLPVARAANTGVSAMIAPDGRVTAEIPLGRAGHVDAALPAALPPPPYARLGEWIFAALLTLTLLAAIAARRRG